uniref:Uncharacterized protein n=1 Tax=Rhizophora mucronata TaxID=61149 RepID=A0A2P2QAG9_RHIMU
MQLLCIQTIKQAAKFLLCSWMSSRND